MRAHTLLALAAAPLLTAAALNVQAADRQTASYEIDADVKLTTDQRTRGMSDSLNKPALKLGLEIAHESGLVGVAELATVSSKEFLGGNGTDLTLGGGYRFGDPDGWHFGVGLATEIFPDAKFDAPHGFDLTTFTPTDVRSTNYNTSFAVFEINYGAIEGRILDVISKTYRGADTGGVCGQLLQFDADPTAGLNCYARGDHDSRGTLLLDLDYKFDIAKVGQMTLHVGHQKVANFDEANFTDYRIGLMRKQWGFEWSADWVTTRGKVRTMYLYQDGNEVRSTDDSKLVLSVMRRF